MSECYLWNKSNFTSSCLVVDFRKGERERGFSLSGDLFDPKLYYHRLDDDGLTVGES